MKLKDKIDMFLVQNYKNLNTRKLAGVALQRIAHLEKIEISEINKIYESIPQNILSNSSKITELAFIKKFLKTISEIDGVFYNYNLLAKYDNDTKPKSVFTDTELDNILLELRLFNNKKFEIIFKLLLFNGCRLNEFMKVPWNKLHESNFIFTAKASKNGNFRTFSVPEDLKQDLLNIKIDYSYNTIQNLFIKFEKYYKSKNPSFCKRITAHILRAQLITDLHLRGASLSEIQCVTGHVNSDIISSKYIKTNSTYHLQLMKLANLPISESLEVEKLLNNNKILSKEVVKLRTILINMENDLKEKNEKIKKYQQEYGEISING